MAMQRRNARFVYGKYWQCCPLSADEHCGIDFVNIVTIFMPLSESLVMLSECSKASWIKALPRIQARRAFLQYFRREVQWRYGRLLAELHGSLLFRQGLDFVTTYEMQDGEVVEIADV